MSTYYKVEIAATSEQEAGETLNALLEKKFVAGGHFAPVETRHWWDGKIDTATYYIVTGYTVPEKKEGIEKVVREISTEEVPGVVFFNIDDANKDFLEWIEENT